MALIRKFSFINCFQILFLLIISLITIKCTDIDSCNCTISNGACNQYGNCPEECRLYKNKTYEECVFCTGWNSSNYYTFNNEVSSQTIICTVKEAGNIEESYLLVDSSNLLVSSICPDDYKYQLGSYCYKKQPANSQCNNNYTCNCLYNSTEAIEIENSKLKRKKCLDIGKKPTENGFSFITIISGNKFKFTKECPNEDDKKYEVTISNQKYYYCLNECPTNSKYYYTSGENAYHCISKCDFENKGDFNNGTICFNDTICPGYIKVEPNKNNFECIEDDNNCPTDNAYLYINETNNQKYCLKSCQYTKSIPFFNTETYTLEQIDGIKINYTCLEENPSDKNYYIDKLSMKLVEDCRNSETRPYHNETDKTCYSSCEKYIKGYECVESCDDSYIDEETGTCVDQCPINLNRGFANETTKICVTCNISQGFYKASDRNCSSSCPVGYYHNFNDNFCFEQECQEHSSYKYHYENEYVCYESCLNINNSILFEKNYTCFMTDPGSDLNYTYKYKTNENITKYIMESELLTECYANNLKYINESESECMEDCPDNINTYKILPTANKMGECIQINDNDFSTKCKYYNKSSNICSNTCKFFEIKYDGTTFAIDGENCVENCTSGYYKNIEDRSCISSCEEYTDNSTMQCVSRCEKGFFEIMDDKKYCVEKCNKTDDNGISFANYLTTGECQQTCPNETRYSLETTNDHQLCLENCPSDKPYHKGNFCVKECDYYSNGDCAENCTGYEYILLGNICSNDTCRQNAPFYYLDNSNLKICNTSCPDNYLINFTESSNAASQNIFECISFSSCNGVKYENGCYDKCPDGLFNSNGNCTSNCPSKFYKDRNDYICIDSCNDTFPYETTSHECVANCPIGENYININNNNCTSKCDDNDFYYVFNQGEYNNKSYNIYKCIDNCTNNDVNDKKLLVSGTKECVSECGSLYIYNSICYQDCLSIPGFNYSLKEMGSDGNYNYTCSDSCKEKYFGSNQICVDSCNELAFNKTANQENKCLKECDLKSENKFLFNMSGSFFCNTTCGANQRYLSSNYKCLDKCPDNKNFVVRNDDNTPVECLDKCPDNISYAYYDEEKNEYYCSNDECGKDTDNQKYYYFNDKICRENCSSDYIISGTNICTKLCDTYDSKKLYLYDNTTIKQCVFNCSETDFNKTSIDGRCVKECGANEFYDENDLICRIKCPKGKKIDGNICRDSCNVGVNIFEDENGYCVDNCTKSTTGYIYHKENDNKCLNSCPNLYMGNNCTDSCGDKFIYDKFCLDECLPSKIFYIETETNKTCLNDCPKDLPYYKKNENPYKCLDNCTAYLPNSYLNAKICVEVCNDTYPYFIESNSTKICYSSCPDDYPYYEFDKDETHSENLQCYKNCPEGYVHFEGKYQCIVKADCNGKIKINENLCVDQCSKTDYLYENTAENITYCVDNCSVVANQLGIESNLSRTEDFRCVDDCSKYSDFSEPDINICKCPRLFYYDKLTGQKKCLNPDYTLCENITDYPIIQMNENECTDYCNGILSLSGFECYNNESYPCENNEFVDTEINGKKRCKCVDKYYQIIENGRTIKKCLSKNEDCPLDHPFLIKETKQCVENCQPNDFNKEYKLEFGKICVKKCPSHTVENNDKTKCECSGKWYLTDNYDVLCVKDCPNNKNILITETKQCVSSCIRTGYEVYYNNTCITDCIGIQNRIKASTYGDSNMKNISNEYCRCTNIWYYDKYNNEVCNEDNSSCDSFKYMINATKQCVNKCPEGYSYSFNGICYINCETGLVMDENSKTCKCPYLWKYIENETGKIECLPGDDCPDDYLLISHTNECYKNSICPKNAPYIFDKKCYEKDKCPQDLNTKEDEINQKCICLNRWYKDSHIICLGETNDCPGDYPYYDPITKECQQNKPTGSSTDQLYQLFEFNYTLYRNCPDKTKPNYSDLTCECDPTYGYWYTYIDQVKDKKYTICGVKECASDEYTEYQKKECLKACPSDHPYSYEKICYSNCPNLTEEIGSSKECQLKTVDNNIKLDDLKQTLTENILKLYNPSYSLNDTSSVGQKIATQNATAEFYGVNRKGKGKAKGKEKNVDNIQSDLSFIDISDCIDKLYHSYQIDDRADIIILKFDMNKMPMNYLIKPVEYRLINSLTGQEIDASICEHNSIKISYPVHDLINKFDQMLKNLRKLEYVKIDLTSNNKDSLREKIDRGKEINQEYSNIDIFNINSQIYSDICMAVEVDGKDLILEDRFNYFYPQMSLCENNCTYNHTDFINERIYCDCSYKTEFDFEREYTPSYELTSNPNNNNDNSNSNIEVMKCISNMKYSKSLSGNGGFIYSLIMIIIEAALLVIIIFYGIKSLADKLKNKNSNEDENYDKININVVNTDKKTYEDIKTSERNLENPPRKKKEELGIEFIPQEYLFLFFNQGEKDVIKKVERDSVPFKTKINTRILLEQKKGVNYDNINPRGPYPAGQNILVIVENMNEDINDYINYEESENEEINKRGIKNRSDLKEKNDQYDLFNRTKRSSKKGNSKNDNKDSIKVSQKAKLYRKRKFDEFSITDYDPSNENYSNYDFEEDEDNPHEKGFMETLKRNHKYLKRDYDIAKNSKNANFVEVLFTEIIDKIYITNILFFTRKFDIFSLQLSVYFLCHILLLVLNALFFDIKTIKKIWRRNEDYPGLGYYLGFGFLACLIIWVVYRIILCLWNNNDKIKDILKYIHFNKKYNLNKERAINKQCKNVIGKIKFKVAVYSIIEFLLLTFCFIYLSAFGTVFTGTMSKVFKAYGIALIEILIIKIIYGIALAIMRYISLTKEKRGLYEVVLFMDTYLV